MNMKALANLFLLTLLLLLLLPPTLAQESTEAPLVLVPTVETVAESPVVVEAPAPEAPLFDENTMLIAGSILLVVIVGGAFFLAIKALEALKVSVPQETITAFGTQLISIMNSTMASAKMRSEETDTPIDDLLVAIAKVPSDFLISEIKRRALTDAQNASLTMAITPPKLEA